MIISVVLWFMVSSVVVSFRLNGFSLKSQILKPAYCSVLHKQLFIDEYNKRKPNCMIKNAFDNLMNENEKLPFDKFLNFEGMQRLIKSHRLTPANLEQIWKVCVDKELKPASFEQFLKVNDGLDDFFGESIAATENPDFHNPWNPNRPIEPRFVENTVEHLRKYFDSVAVPQVQPIPVEGADNRYMTFRSFADWEDVSDLLELDFMKLHFVKDLWQEALEYKYRNHPSPDKNNKHSILPEEMLMRISSKGMYNNAEPAYCIDFDTFLRLNFRLDEVVEDSRDKKDRAEIEEYDELFRKEFRKLSNYEKLITFDQLVEWDTMKQILDNGDFTFTQLQQLWNAVPKKLLPVNEDAPVYAPSMKTDIQAVDMASFLLINHEIQARLRGDV